MHNFRERISSVAKSFKRLPLSWGVIRSYPYPGGSFGIESYILEARVINYPPPQLRIKVKLFDITSAIINEIMNFKNKRGWD